MESPPLPSSLLPSSLSRVFACFGDMGYLEIFCLVSSLVLIPKICEAFVVMVWRPFALTRRLGKQGVRGPPYKLMKGSLEEINMREAGRAIILDTKSHDFLPKVLPHYLTWISQYGNTFLHWLGTHPRICIVDVELVRQILSNKFGFYEKLEPRASLLALLGKGLVLIKGSEWARHRRVINPAFSIDKLK